MGGKRRRSGGEVLKRPGPRRGGIEGSHWRGGEGKGAVGVFGGEKCNEFTGLPKKSLRKLQLFQSAADRI